MMRMTEHASMSGPHDKEGQQTACLYVIATPIGNLDDLAPRAQMLLREVDLVLAEDTRSFKTLAARFGIENNVKSFHEHNEAARTSSVLPRLLRGERVALVSDAGTPTVSDPGYRLVNACRDAGIEVQAVPGPCAAIAALSISGFETHAFTFRGFLPVKSGKRRKILEQAVALEHPTIFYESPHRIERTLSALNEIDAEGEVFLARELTKLHEQSLRGRPGELSEVLEQQQSFRGEFVLIVRGQHRKRRKPATAR